MAKILFGALMVDMRGKVNGTVFAKNKGGAYARTKVTPNNPQTAAQNLVRSRLTGRSQAWRALGALVIAAWNAAVSNFPRTNVFGNQQILSGHQLYVGLNNQLQAAGASTISSPPTPVGAAAISALSLDAAVGADSFSVTYGPTPVPANTAMIIEASPQVSPGKTNVNSLYRQIGVEAAADTSPGDLFAAYTKKFGTLIAGQKVSVRCRMVNTLTGEVSGAVTSSAIVAA